MKKLILFSFLLVSCIPYKPDYVDSEGKEYSIRRRCIRSHNETKYGYHYGYNFMNSKFEWHYGYHTENICEEYKLDTVEINIDKKYYK